MRKGNKTYKWVGVILGVILIVNLPPVRWFSYFYVQNYTYSNYTGEFVAGEEYGKGGSFETVKLQFKDYSKSHTQEKDQKLYRTFSIKPWRFWDWYQWFGSGRDRFFLPYLSKEELRKNKGR